MKQISSQVPFRGGGQGVGTNTEKKVNIDSGDSMYQDGHRFEDLEEMDDFPDTVNYQNGTKNWKT